MPIEQHIESLKQCPLPFGTMCVLEFFEAGGGKQNTTCEIYLLSKSQLLETDFRNIMELVSKPVAVERSADIVVRA
jgi:hypothetical protein